MNVSKTSAAGAVTSPQEITAPRRLIATIGVLLALALTSIDLSVVSAAMPMIAEDLRGLSLYSWVGVSYAVAAAVILPVAGKLGDQFGRKPFLLGGLFGFLIASLLCGMAQSMLQLVVFRTVQGLFAGILMANIFTVVADIFTAEKRAQMQGIFFGVAGLSMVIGPPIGGVITDNFSWRWVFYLNVPILLVAMVAIAAGVPVVRSGHGWRDIDFRGVLLLIAGLVPILVGLTITGSGHGWTSPEVLILLLGGAAVLVAFFLAERRAAHPIVPFSLFRGNQFAVLAVMSFFTAFAMMGAIFFVPLQMQGVLGTSATYAGSVLSPMMFALMIVPPLASKALTLIPRYRFMGTFALGCIVAGLFLLSTIDTGSGTGTAFLAVVLLGIGIGISFPMATIVVQSAVPKELMGVGTSQMQFWRMIAGPVSLAVLGSILTGQVGDAARSDGTAAPAVLAESLHALFLVAAAVVVIGLVATLFLKEIPLQQPAKSVGKTDRPAGTKPAAGTEQPTKAPGLVPVKPA